MEKITVRDLIRTAADRYERQFGESRYFNTDRSKALRELDSEAATVEDVEKILSAAWTRQTCNECGEWASQDVFRVGEEHGYESATARLCLSCVKKLCQLAGLELKS